MKKFDVKFMVETIEDVEARDVFSDILNDYVDVFPDSLDDYVEAETAEEAIDLAIEFLKDFINNYGDFTAEVDSKNEQITVFDKNGKPIELYYDFEAEEVVEYYNKYGDYNVMTKEDFDFWKEDEPEFMSGITII